MAYKPYIKKANGEIQEIPIVATKLGESNLGSSDTPIYLESGTAKACNKSLKNNSQIVDLIYPVGSIYLTIGSTSPAILFGGSWEQIAQGRALFGAGTLSGNTYTAGSTKDAGLPNITGESSQRAYTSQYPTSGALYKISTTRTPTLGSGIESKTESVLGFDASLSNNIYGNSTTVQPNAYVVNVWKRTA